MANKQKELVCPTISQNSVSQQKYQQKLSMFTDTPAEMPYHSSKNGMPETPAMHVNYSHENDSIIHTYIQIYKLNFPFDHLQRFQSPRWEGCNDIGLAFTWLQP
mmetsp:Transcript_37306/g.49168  ORF Transcript_37306/g.49168 Transcript_37306/m.49168 type:complete len:104 (+) Transcript_37306:102-413(+)